MVKVGIIGSAGYTAGELIRILVNHPEAEIVWAQSESNAGKCVSDVHQGLVGDTGLVFCSDVDLESADVVFLCSGHGKSAGFWADNPKPEGLKVIDLAQDFRDESDGYVYGLPEWQSEKISRAEKIANPGCFATCIQLALLPLAAVGKLSGDVGITAVTGSTGAGVKPGATTHFSWRNNNISSYKVFEHQHLIEINRNLGIISRNAGGFQLDFIPMRGDFARGIFASITLNCKESEGNVRDLYKSFYSDAAFTHVVDRAVDLKDVVNTNKCLVSVEKHGGKLVVSSVIDNLLKGASGQAVQNMNLMSGLPEKTGLNLKASAF
ncbi:MAG: N-acetyl-gamma-glutamyl-phosphate reductase [Bacteroidales bacterium]|nr:N-acetyl-gamma-glutamyl-phosphate reductase [Bacteroidales bacterium]